MNSFSLLTQDPSAAVEFIAAILTACYVLRLALAPAQPPFGRDDKKMVMPLLVTPLSPRNKKANLRDKLLRLFAVGEMVFVSKRSLNGQTLQIRRSFW